MGTILKIAIRNLIQHKVKTIVIGIIITFGLTLTVVGNSLLDTGVKNLKRSFVDNFTGDVIITTRPQFAGIFGTRDGGASGPPDIPILRSYDKIYPYLEKNQDIKSFTSQMSAYGMYNLDEKGMDFQLFFGIDPVDYQKTFDNVIILQGHMLQPGEKGLLLHEKKQASLKKEFQVDLKVGDTVQLNNFGERGFHIQEVPIVGIFKFKSGNDRVFPFMLPSLVDINTLRTLNGRNYADDEGLDNTATAVDQSVPEASSDDDLFSGPMVTQTQSANFDIKAIQADLKDRPETTTTSDPRKGTWNFFLIKLKAGVTPEKMIGEFNDHFRNLNQDVLKSILAEKSKPSAHGWAGIQETLKSYFPKDPNNKNDKGLNQQEIMDHLSADQTALTTLAKTEGAVAPELRDFFTDVRTEFSRKSIQAWAQDWKSSASPDSNIFDGVSFVFNFFIFLIAIVTTIIIMNTLVGSVMERTPEIGTMRALGAQKKFIRRLFFLETLTLSVVFGIIGILVGMLILFVLSFFSIPLPEGFLRAILGGDSIHPEVNISQITMALVFIVIIGFFSWRPPVRMAQRISPLKAMQAD